MIVHVLDPPQVLAELKEYATEVDVDFVRKAVRAIGRCAIKVEASVPCDGIPRVPFTPVFTMHFNIYQNNRARS